MANEKVKKTTPAVKGAKKTVAKADVKKTALKKVAFEMAVMGLDGSKKGTIQLPKEIFGAKLNPELMAQAVRVYLANQRAGTSSTKTRGEVAGSTRKIYRQKGTGRARHGASKAPIFIGGGIAFGPRPRDYGLDMPKKMRRAALLSSLTAQYNDSRVVVVENVDGLSGKTKEVMGMFRSLQLLNKAKKADKVLFVLGENGAQAKKAIRNIEGVTIRNVVDLNTYEVLNSNHVVFVKNSIEMFSKPESK